MPAFQSKWLSSVSSCVITMELSKSSSFLSVEYRTPAFTESLSPKCQTVCANPERFSELVVFWPFTSSAVGTKAGIDTCCELVNSPLYQKAPTVQSSRSLTELEKRASKVLASTFWMPSTSCTLKGDWSESVAKAPSNLEYEPISSSSAMSEKRMFALALSASCSKDVFGLVVKPVTGSWYVA